MARGLLALTGILVGFLAGLVSLVAMLLVEAASLGASTSLDFLNGSALLFAELGPDGAAHWLASAAVTLWIGAVGLCFVPVCLVGLTGAVARATNVIWYAGGTGALAAALPILLRTMVNPASVARLSFAEGRLTLMFFLSGTLSGFIYWAIAGRRDDGA